MKASQKSRYIRHKKSMAKVTVMLNEQYKSQDKTYPIIIRVAHQGHRRMIPVGWKVSERFWEKDEVSTKHPDHRLINAAIAEKVSRIKTYLADCQLRGRRVNMDLLDTGQSSHSFTQYLDHRAAQYKAAGKIVMDQKVRRFALEMRAAFGGEVYFEDVNLDWLRRLEAHQIENGNVENTRAKKFKFLREFYGQAIKEEKAPAPNPFKDYKIVSKPTKKEKLTAAQVKAIEDLRLVLGPINDARNIFLFSYYCKGQRFEVCATFRAEQVREGRIFFRTNKGNDFISVKIHDRLEALLSQYNKEGFVFPYVTELPTDKKAYLSLIGSNNTTVNRYLKIVGKLAKIPFPLTMHIARHSFAYQLKKVSDNIHVIKESLGHSDYRTTEIYLKALDDEQLDKDMEKLYGK